MDSQRIPSSRDNHSLDEPETSTREAQQTHVPSGSMSGPDSVQLAPLKSQPGTSVGTRFKAAFRKSGAQKNQSSPPDDAHDEREARQYLTQTGLPPGQKDSGGILANANRFLRPAKMRELPGTVTDTARVKRHNTASWVTGNIDAGDYSRLPVPLSDIRSQHGISGIAVDKTAKRAESIGQWLEENPHAVVMDIPTLDHLAPSSDPLTIGWGGAERFIVLNGTGRIEAIRRALSEFEAKHARAHPLRSVETFAAALTEDEFAQLHRTSEYFLDETGSERVKPVHDLVAGTAPFRLIAGTLMNLVKHHAGRTNPHRHVDRRLPVELDTESSEKD